MPTMTNIAFAKYDQYILTPLVCEVLQSVKKNLIFQALMTCTTTYALQEKLYSNGVITEEQRTTMQKTIEDTLFVISNELITLKQPDATI